MFLEPKNAVFANTKRYIFIIRSLSTCYQTVRELRFFDRKDSWCPKYDSRALNEANLSIAFKKLTNDSHTYQFELHLRCDLIGSSAYPCLEVTGFCHPLTNPVVVEAQG